MQQLHAMTHALRRGEVWPCELFASEDTTPAGCSSSSPPVAKSDVLQQQAQENMTGSRIRTAENRASSNRRRCSRGGGCSRRESGRSLSSGVRTAAAEAVVTDAADPEHYTELTAPRSSGIPRRRQQHQTTADVHRDCTRPLDSEKRDLVQAAYRQILSSCTAVAT